MLQEDGKEYRYPLSSEDGRVILDLYESEAATAKEKLRLIFITCLEECNSTPANCDKHKRKYRKILRELYTRAPWVPYRPVTFIVEINMMFDSGVDAQVITERVTKEIRRHNRDCLCTFAADDDAAEKRLKMDVRALYDDDKIPENVIHKYIKDKREERIRFMSTSQQTFLRAISESRPDDPNVLEIIKRELCTIQSTDSKRLKEFRTKWASMIDAGKTWTFVHSVMIADIWELKQSERDQEEIGLALIALDKEKARKAAAKRAKEARRAKRAQRAQRAFVLKQRLYSKYSRICAGCQNIAVPDYSTGVVHRCQVCKGLFDHGLQMMESYYCSDECARENGGKHMLLKHPCTAGDACVNPDRQAFEVFAQYCPGCWDRWGIVSYICNLACYDKNWENHWTKMHPRMEEEYNELGTKEEFVVKLGEGSESSAEEKGKGDGK